MTGELRTLLPPFGKSAGQNALAGLPKGAAQGVGFDDFALYTALRAARRAAGGAAANYLVSWPFNIALVDGSLHPALTNQRLILVPQLVPPGEAIDGVTWVQTTTGAYTAVNTNGVAAYTFDGTTFTRVAQGTNANIWKAGVGVGTQAFGVQLAASSSWRLLWAAGLWNQSAVVTAPVIGGLTVGGGGIGANSGGLGAYAFQVDNAGNTNFPASFAGVTAGDTNREWLAFYRNYA